MTLEGSLVRLEPLESRHEDTLWEAAQDERTFRWFPYVRRDWLPFAQVVGGVPLG